MYTHKCKILKISASNGGNGMSSNATDDEKSRKAVAVGPNEGTCGSGDDCQTVAKVIDLITLDPEQTDVDLNHGRIGKIENFEPLVNLERYFFPFLISVIIF